MSEEALKSTDPNHIKFEKLEAEILKIEKVLSAQKKTYSIKKKTTLRILLETFVDAEDLLQKLSKNFDRYRKAVLDLEEALTDRGDSKDKSDKEVDMESFKVEQDNFASLQATLWRRELLKESRRKGDESWKEVYETHLKGRGLLTMFLPRKLV